MPKNLLKAKSIYDPLFVKLLIINNSHYLQTTIANLLDSQAPLK